MVHRPLPEPIGFPVTQLLRTPLLAFAVSVTALAVSPAPAAAQGFGDLAIGWTAVPSTPVSGDYRFAGGPVVRASLGQPVATRVRLRTDASLLFFKVRTEIPTPCPFPQCTGTEYDDNERLFGGVSESALFALDAGGRTYLIGGVGIYATQVQNTSIHEGLYGGVGTEFPMQGNRRLFFEASWQANTPRTNSPQWLLPVTAGIRF